MAERSEMLALVLFAAGCGRAAPNVPMTGGPCTYEHFETTCDFVESGAMPNGKTWAKFRPRGLDAIGRIEVEPNGADRDAVVRALHQPISCRGDRITSGSCSPFSMILGAPQLPAGASVTYSGLD